MGNVDSTDISVQKREQEGACWRCCSAWGETVIRVECKDGGRNATREAEVEKEKAAKEAKEKERAKLDGWEKKEPEEKDSQRELGFS